MLDFEIPQNFTLIHKFRCSLWIAAEYFYWRQQQKEVSKIGNLSVGLPGLEPGKAGPESAVLPLHHSPMLKCDAKVQLFFDKKIFSSIFCLKN